MESGFSPPSYLGGDTETQLLLLTCHTKNTIDGRDADYHGHPILIADILTGLGGPRMWRVAHSGPPARCVSEHSG
jgi:hypothetical protein